MVKQINTKSDLVEFAKKYNLRPDWHEPDEQGIDARIIGVQLDNAFGANMRKVDWGGELRVVLTHEEHEDPQDVAVVNLADLFAWAATEHLPATAPMG